MNGALGRIIKYIHVFYPSGRLKPFEFVPDKFVKPNGGSHLPRRSAKMIFLRKLEIFDRRE